LTLYKVMWYLIITYIDYEHSNVSYVVNTHIFTHPSPQWYSEFDTFSRYKTEYTVWMACITSAAETILFQ